MAAPCRAAVVLLCVCRASLAIPVHADPPDYGGIPLWVDRLQGEPSVMSVRGRGLHAAWHRANHPSSSASGPEPRWPGPRCPESCDCPVQWPTAIYCDHRSLEDVARPLPSDTQYLFLQGNNLTSLSPALLANATGLRWLILDHNHLGSDVLQRDTLQNQSQLRYLFANGNRLTAVPAGLPAGLRQLRLAHNRIDSVDRDALQALPNLTLLLLQGNRLRSVAEHSFAGLASLTLLDLSGNLFSAVPKHLPSSLQQLYMSNNNQLAGLGEDSFAGLRRLQYLRLSHCGLQSADLHPQALRLPSLVELDLSYNRLSVTPAVPSTLQYLYLEANQIQEFNVTSFCQEVGPLSYSRMKVLRLDGNKMSTHQLPPEWVYCLRVIQNIYI